MNKVIIIGAGISGLALAFRLRQAVPALDLLVLEQRDRPGGTMWTERRDGFQVEIGPNGFLDSKPSTVALCKDLGLGERLVSASEAAGRNRYLFLGGKLKALPAGLGDLVRTDLLSWRGKLALLTEPFRSRRRERGDESVHDFARRRAGKEVAEVLADALVTGIYASDSALLSLPATFPRIAALEAEYGSVIKGFGRQAKERRRAAAARGEPYQRPGRMWSFREGLRLLVDALRERLPQPPVLGVRVRRLERTEMAESRRPGWVVAGEGQERWSAEAVVLACPAYQQAVILADLDRELADAIGAIAYNQVAVVALGYRREDVPGSLDGFGYIAPQRTRRDVLGVQWCSSIFPERAPPGQVLLRAMCGGWHRPEVVGWDDDRLLAAVRDDLRQAMGIVQPPIFHTIVRWDRAIPQYHLGHLERVARIEERAGRHPGLFLAGNAYHGVALNDCTEQAEILAQRVRDFFSPQRHKEGK
jgi:oxygen-dependent protoporphyrinogen oxidase